MAARRINLLPPDLAQRRRARQFGAAMGAAGLALVGLLAIVYFAQEVRLRSERTRLEEQEDRNAEIRSEIARLSEFDRLENQLEDKTDLLAQLTENEVRWSVLLADVSLVIPADVWLTQFTGNVEVGTASDDDEDAAARSLGTIQMTGSTFSHLDVARWLTRLGGVDGFAFPYLSLSTKAQIGETPVVNFSSTVQLSSGAQRKNQRGAQRKI